MPTELANINTQKYLLIDDRIQYNFNIAMIRSFYLHSQTLGTMFLNQKMSKDCYAQFCNKEDKEKA